MDLSELKRDRDLFLAFLGLRDVGKHLRCPFHDSADCFSVWQGNDGIWIWKCHAGCGTGTIIDAAMKRYNVNGCREACNGIEKELGVVIDRDEEYIEPIIDMDRASKLIVEAHKYLMNNYEVQERWLLGKRGISNLEVIERFRIGFLPDVTLQFKSKKNKSTYPVKILGWCLPITNADDTILAVKLHMERPPWPQGPKCMFAPFGTYPADEPRHGVYTLWPPPEFCPAGQDLYVHPGELKAVAAIASGFYATAPTSGENGFPKHFAKRIWKCQPSKVFVAFDDDKPKKTPTGKMVSAGNDWKDAVKAALTTAGVACYPFSFGSPLPEESFPSTMPDGAQLEENHDNDQRSDSGRRQGEAGGATPAGMGQGTEPEGRLQATGSVGGGSQQPHTGADSSIDDFSNVLANWKSNEGVAAAAVDGSAESGDVLERPMQSGGLEPGSIGEVTASWNRHRSPAAVSVRPASEPETLHSILVREVEEHHADRGEACWVNPQATTHDVRFLREMQTWTEKYPLIYDPASVFDATRHLT